MRNAPCRRLIWQRKDIIAGYTRRGAALRKELPYVLIPADKDGGLVVELRQAHTSMINAIVAHRRYEEQTSTNRKHASGEVYESLCAKVQHVQGEAGLSQ